MDDYNRALNPITLRDGEYHSASGEEWEGGFQNEWEISSTSHTHTSIRYRTCAKSTQLLQESRHNLWAAFRHLYSPWVKDILPRDVTSGNRIVIMITVI